MTGAERRERGTLLCRQITGEVAAFAPEGLGGWEHAWDIAAEPDAEFLIALTRWEQTGVDEDKPALRRAYFNLREAWRQAATEFERERAER